MQTTRLNELKRLAALPDALFVKEFIKDDPFYGLTLSKLTTRREYDVLVFRARREIENLIKFAH